MTIQPYDSETRQSVIDIIRHHLDLPSTDMPAARMDDPDVDAWSVLRAYLLDEADAYLGDEVRLSSTRGTQCITLVGRVEVR